MSIQTVEWERSNALDDRLGKPDGLRFPDDWTLSQSWQRAQTEHDRGAPVTDAERYVYLEESEQPHRVVWALSGQSLRAECDCGSYHPRGSGRTSGACSFVLACHASIRTGLAGAIP